MEAQHDDPTVEAETASLARHDAERVKAEMDQFAETEPTEHAVPTEYLHEGAGDALELPVGSVRAGGAARMIAHYPGTIMAAIISVSIVLLIWVASTAGDKFSVGTELFEPRSDTELKFYRYVKHLEEFDAAKQLGDQHAERLLNARNASGAAHPERRLLGQCGPNGDIAPRGRLDKTKESVTIVYTRRGGVDNNVLRRRQLAEVFAACTRCACE